MHAANPLTQPRWSPYVAGAGIGVLSWATALFSGKYLGTSSAFVHLTGLLEAAVARAHVVGPEAAAYYAKEISKNTPMLDWQVMLVVGVLIGAFASNRLASTPQPTECVPGLWAWRFGPSKAVRYTAAFAAGALMLFGARLAGGCTSGHAISGGLQLALSSWVFMAAMFTSGIATAFLLFGPGGRAHVRD